MRRPAAECTASLLTVEKSSFPVVTVTLHRLAVPLGAARHVFADVADVAVLATGALVTVALVAAALAPVTASSRLGSSAATVGRATSAATTPTVRVFTGANP
jgi:hypothetical protein